ncbi:phenazine biosynthesis protein PhzF [Vibrio phage SHOU24]|uniref:phenazine biosynthesis protein PhzF n=1 Tax=Vibrio phage SHOU24 TaxID=1414739 RepID=UPI0003ED253F|nr:phenazine biosynthesis protein PhzF [Vibrio phage SHOU24]AHI61245.1 phenazine biosynthesis protein PhzF [Vibrio phage SHOU24]
MKYLANGVYKVKVTDEDGDVTEMLSELSDGCWYVFGNDVGIDEENVQVICRIHWETPEDSFCITPEHPRAQFIVAEIDGKEDLPYAKNLSHINLATHEISVWCENGHLTYEDKDGNKEEHLGVEHVTFSPKQFKAYDRDTGIIYAEWNHYEA